LKSTWCKRVCNNVSGVRWQASNFSVDLLVVQSDLRHTYFRVFSSTEILLSVRLTYTPTPVAMSTLRIHVTVFYCPSVVAETCSHGFIVSVFPGFCSGSLSLGTFGPRPGSRFWALVFLTFTCIFPDDVNTALPRVLTFRIIEVFVVTPQNFGSLADLGR